MTMLWQYCNHMMSLWRSYDRGSYDHTIIWSHDHHMIIRSCLHMIIWSYGHMIIRSCDHMVIWSSNKLMIIWLNGHLIIIWSNDHMTIRSYDHMVIWPYGRLIRWSCDHMIIWSYDHLMHSCDLLMSGHSQGTGNIIDWFSGQRPGWEMGKLIIKILAREAGKGWRSGFLICAEPVGIGEFSIHLQ